MASVMSTVLSRLNAFLDSELEQILCFDSAIDAEKFASEKSAIFLILPEEDTTKNFMAGLMIQNLSRELFAVADENGGKLKNRVVLFCDEFGTMPPFDILPLFSAGRSRRLTLVPIIQSLAQLEKNYGREGCEIIQDNCQDTIFGGFAPNSQTAEVLSKALGSRTVLSGSVSRGKNDPSQSLQMMERALLTPDELKSIPKGSFIVMKTGTHPMRTQLQLFLNWGITFGEPYTVPERANRAVAYQRGADGKPEIVPEEAEVVRRIYRRYLEGCSEGQIQRELTQDGIATAKGVKAWSHQIVHNILTNEKYAGDALLQKTFTTDCISKKVKKNTGELPQYYIKDNHPAIIPRDIYQRVQEEMARRTSKRKILQKSGKTEQGKYSAKYALSERLVCGECGSPYKRCTWARNGVKRIVWRCVSRLEFGKKYCHESPSVEEYKLHAAILTTLNRVVEASNGLQEELAETLRMVCVPGGDGDDLLDLEHELEVLTARQNTLLDQALANMDDLTITEQLKTLLEEKQHLQARIDAVKTKAANRISEDSRMAELTAYLEEHLSGFQQYDDGIVRQLVERITVVDAETIRVKFRYSDLEIEQSVC